MILALKTADFTTQAWLFADPHSPEAVDHLEWESGRQLSEQLLGRLVGFLQSHQLSLQDLTGIVIFSGPGSFTSLRIGHATANALADSLGIPVAGSLGEHWQDTGRKALATATIGQSARPHYGAEANITRPKS